MKKFLVILSPFAPHIAEELWQEMGHKDSIYHSKWPEIKNIKNSETTNITVMVNGKTRATVQINSEKTEKQIIDMAKAETNVQKYLEGKKIVKSIYITGKVVSFVVK